MGVAWRRSTESVCLPAPQSAKSGSWWIGRRRKVSFTVGRIREKPSTNFGQTTARKFSVRRLCAIPLRASLSSSNCSMPVSDFPCKCTHRRAWPPHCGANPKPRSGISRAARPVRASMPGCPRDATGHISRKCSLRAPWREPSTSCPRKPATVFSFPAEDCMPSARGTSLSKSSRTAIPPTASMIGTAPVSMENPGHSTSRSPSPALTSMTTNLPSLTSNGESWPIAISSGWKKSRFPRPSLCAGRGNLRW